MWDCMLCACVSEEGEDGEGAGSETPSLLSYTLRYVSLAELGTLCRVGLRDPMHLCTCVRTGCPFRRFCFLPSFFSFQSVKERIWKRVMEFVQHRRPAVRHCRGHSKQYSACTNGRGGTCYSGDAVRDDIVIRACSQRQGRRVAGNPDVLCLQRV